MAIGISPCPPFSNSSPWVSYFPTLKGKNICVTGDSIARGVDILGPNKSVGTLIAEMCQCNEVTLAFPADSSDDQLLKWNALAAGVKSSFDYVIVCDGNNDIVFGADIYFVSRILYQDLLDQIKADIQASCKIVCCTMTPTIADYDGINDAAIQKLRQSFNELIKGNSFDRAFHQDLICNAYTLSMDDGSYGLKPEYWANGGDIQHPNEAGRRVMAISIMNVIKNNASDCVLNNEPLVFWDGNTWQVQLYNETFNPDYDLSSSMTLNGTLLTKWRDLLRQGNGHELEQADLGLAPNLNANGVLFDGTEYMSIGVNNKNQPLTMYFVINQKTWSANDAICDGGAGESGFGTNSLVTQRAATPGLKANAGTMSNQNDDLALDTYGILTVVFDGANSSLQINNNAPVTGDFGSWFISDFSLGAQFGGGNPSNIEVKAVVRRFVNETAGNRTIIKNRLAAKFGIVL